MFRKKSTKKTAQPSPVEEASSASRDLFRFSVLPPEMRVAARDFSTLQALAALQDAQSPAPVLPVPPPVRPTPAPPQPELDIEEEEEEDDAPEAAPARRGPSRIVLVGGLFLFFSIGAGAVFFLYSLRVPDSEIPAVATIPLEDDAPFSQVENPVIIEPRDPEVSPGRDTDSDGLTDVEERLFGTDIRNPDSDDDTYLDNNEVFHGYDPASPDPALLSDSSRVDIYTSSVAPLFTVLRMATWTIPEASPTQTSVSLSAPPVLRILSNTGSEFRITSRPLGDSVVTLDAWYEANGAEWFDRHGRSSDLQNLVTKQGYPARLSIDSRLAFVQAGEYVFTFEYDLGSERTIEYPLIFQMMLNSFVLLPAPQPSI